MGKIRVVTKKAVYLWQAILDLGKTIVYEFHYDYMFPKYLEHLKLCYMDTDSFVHDVKTDDFYITDYVEATVVGSTQEATAAAILLPYE